MPRHEPEILTWVADRRGIMRAVVNPKSGSRPAICNRCRKQFDLGHVEIIARYAECSVWNCPNGCGAVHDDRQQWGSSPQHRMGYIDLSRSA